GVGFYSAFMLADRVTVQTRSCSESAGWQWESDGSGSFTIAPAVDLPRGTRVILHLRDDARDFAKSLRLKTVLQKYSSFVPHPIRLDDEVINQQKAIWVEPASQIDADQYDHFYQHLTHQESEKPLWHLHLSVDSPIQFHALLYCPPTNFELLGLGRLEHGLNLCVKRVLVQNDCRELVPEFFRFLRGVVDSEDLPLNISRDALQDNTIFQKIRGTLVRSVLDSLQKMSEKEPERYQTFYGQYARMLKEGAHADFVHRERTVRLLRYASTTAEDAEKPTSLDQYLERCGKQQKQIYYLGGASLQSVGGNPNLEIFRKRGLEVLFLLDPIDEFVLSTLGTYKEHRLVSIDSADLELPETDAEDDDSGEKTPDKEKQETPAGEEADEGFKKVLELFGEALDEKAEDVRPSKRLTDSPCCLVAASAGMSTHMQGLLERVDSEFVAAKPVLEVNPAAPLVVRLSQLSSDETQHEFIRACGQQLFANAQLLEGIVPEPQEMAARMQRFMEQAAGGRE
ncbi:MAG: molecular chaperone HtpG, partial [Planctomycetes bacterium]|nr:molecular chaperone HtpG [Planctomycetota bacterium]